MNIQKTRFCFYAILLIVLSLLASCIDDNEPVDKQETVTLYVSANMGQTSGLTGTMHDCMLVKEKGDDTWNTWAPVTEAVLNLGLSILLGYYYGLTGILSGVLISLLVIVCIWKPLFLYKCGFKENIGEYVIRLFKYLALIAVNCASPGIILGAAAEGAEDFLDEPQAAIIIAVKAMIDIFEIVINYIV
jgi:hypothetical protein